MYEPYYGLTEKPFSIQPDPGFLYFSRRHRLGYAMLEYAIENRAGFAVISGEVGVGKTTLIRRLLDSLPQSTTVGLVSNTHWSQSNLLAWVMQAFGEPFDGMSPQALFDRFQQFLIGQYREGRRVVLIVDEGQNLTPEALEELRLLSNINADKHQLLQIIVTGQPALEYLLERPESRQFAQRIAVDFRLRPLEESEVQSYIEFRLSVAGRKTPLFTPAACKVIGHFSEGIPRRINILCDTALVYGFSYSRKLVDEAIIQEVIGDKLVFGIFSPVASQDDLARAIDELATGKHFGPYSRTP
ncbi:ExeA family protein [Microbulbifer sp. ALW1]|uniref:ExeA family protein n=1 Tax=Microbulbifer sp. (strain ALW1) TaxID=1516059 RepID=UPI001356D05B|nr:AAA family ATPase [Microbulbifer sp. ALW1]